MPRDDVEKILSLLDDEDFVALRRRADRDVLLWGDMSGLKMPAGLDAEEAWRVLTSIRKQTAFTLPWRSYLDIGYSTEAWYTVTRSMARLINQFEARCRRGSELDRTIEAFSESNQLMSQWEMELASAFAWSGVVVEPERIHAVFTGSVTATGGVDRIIRNVHDILLSIDRFTTRRISPGLIEDLHYHVVAGAEDVSEGERKRLYDVIPTSEYHDPDTCVQMICTIASDEYDALLLHPILKLFSVGWFFADFSPVPSWNSLVDVVLRHILLVRWGYPVLRWVPLYPESGDPDYGRIPLGKTFEEVMESTKIDCGYGLDTTAIFHLRLEAMLSKLDELEALAGGLLDVEGRCEKLFRNDPEINYRQRIILVNALQSPLADQRIEPHRKRFRIVYATARADFLDLVDRGYLVKDVSGRAFVFHAHPDLEKLIAQADSMDDQESGHSESDSENGTQPFGSSLAASL